MFNEYWKAKAAKRRKAWAAVAKPHLDGQYAGFGMLTDGFEVLDQIASAKTGRYGYFADVPREPIVIDRMELVEE